MGTITRSFVNGLTTNGVLGASNINNASLNNITSISASAMTLISSATASNSASIEFSLGNYKEYVFYFVNIKPATDGADFTFNSSTDGGGNYNVIKTTTTFQSYHNEADTSTGLGYQPAWDLAQSTSYQLIMRDMGSASDENGNGKLQLFNPSSTTYVKHFIHTASVGGDNNDYETNQFIAGYFNTTSAINAIKFQMDSGNIDDGKILMFGVN